LTDRWLERLRPLCREACLSAKPPYPAEVVLFYVARWSQKKSRRHEPDPELFGNDVLRDVAERIAGNLAADGARVDRLFAREADEWVELKRLLLSSARRLARDAAPDYADDAFGDIAVVVFTGTPPSRAAERLREGPEGPSNEYVFQSPFPFWARRVVINLIIDEFRRWAREREGPPVRAPAGTSQPLDSARIREAYATLPGLLDAIRELPPVQRSVMAMSLTRRDVDRLVRNRLHELAPDLFGQVSPEPASSDPEIAERLGSTARRVTASRSVARRKLARRDAGWELLLDALLPHRSTRPVAAEDEAVAARTGGDDG
jgi:hypothetical protein